MTDGELAELIEDAEFSASVHEANAEIVLELARALRDQRLLNRGVIKALRDLAGEVSSLEAQEAYEYAAHLIEESAP